MKEIGYDLPKFFPLKEPENVAYGHITNQGTNLCVDGKHGGQGNLVYNKICILSYILQVTNFLYLTVVANQKESGC